MIASKDIGLVLRILGQNPTEDQIVEMVMKVSVSGIPGMIVSFPLNCYILATEII